MKHVLQVSLLLLLTTIATGTYSSPTEPLDPLAEATFDPSAYSKTVFIYVNFSDEMPGVGYPDSSRTVTVPQGLAQHIKWQSQGVRDFTAEVLLNPTPGSGGLWIADYPSTKYAHPDSVATIARYESLWRGSTAFRHPGELQAETLFNIWDTLVAHYGGEENFINPFDGAAAVLFMLNGEVLYAYDGVYWDTFYGGLGKTSVYKLGFAFLAGAAPMDPDYKLRGLALIDDETADVRTREFGVTHEYGHMMGCIGHSPSNTFDPLLDQYGHGLDTYYYGTYSVMRNNYIQGMGFVPLHLRDLQRMGFANVVEITEDQSGLEIQDVRLSGNIYKVPVSNAQSQYFLMAYHSGVNEDVQLDINGDPIVKSTGLEVWHIYDGGNDWTESMWDLESAWGRYSDPGPPDNLENYWQTGNEDAIEGFDNHDIWPVLPDGFRDLVEIRNYPGSEKDFFSLSRSTGEFSYRTNPNTYGQASGHRRTPQNIANTMMITIVEERPHSVVVNISLIGKNSLLTPDAGARYYVGDELLVSWGDECSDVLQANCRIEFSPDAGPLPVFHEIARGVPVAGGSYSWVPSEEHITETGRIRIYFTTIAGEQSMVESDLFAIALPVVQYTDKSPDTDLDYEGQPYSTALIDYDGTGPMDLFVSFDSEECGRLFASTFLNPSSQVPCFSNVTSNAFAGSGPPNMTLGIAVADYDNDGHEDFVVASPENSRLYHYDVGTSKYENVTQSMGLGSALENSVTAAWGDYDRDGFVDLFVGRGECYYNPYMGNIGPIRGIVALPDALMRNRTWSDNSFADVSAQVGISPTFPTRPMAAAWGDFNDDQWPDLFVGCQMEPPLGGPNEESTLYVQQNGQLFDQTEALLGTLESFGVNGVTWADMDSDGNIDIVTSNHYGPSNIFYNDGAGSCREKQNIRDLDDVAGHLVVDSDLDGKRDLLFYPNEDSSSVALLRNKTQGGQLEFFDVASAIGLDSPGKTGGAIAADFNGDGDSDILLGRRAVADTDPNVLYGQLFFRATQYGESVDPPSNNWLSVRLRSPHGFNNTRGIGAQVAVYEGLNRHVQICDGGHGRGESNGTDLLFGLGDAASVDSVIVDWPRGTHQVVTGVEISQQLLVEDSTTVEVFSLSGSYQIVPALGLLDYTFTWKTTTWTDDSLDVLEIEGQNGCNPVLTTVTPTDQGVEHSITYSGGHYVHQLTWRNQICTAGCSVQYRVKSEVGGVASDWSDLRYLSIPVCGKNITPQDP